MTTVQDTKSNDPKNWQNGVEQLSAFQKKMIEDWNAGNSLMASLSTATASDISEITLTGDAVGDKIDPA